MSVAREPVDWLLRPERFFPEGALRVATPVIVALVLLVGAASVIDRMDSASLRNLIQPDRFNPVEDWQTYWLAVVGGAILAGPLLYYVGGAWYWLRLRWSGAKAPDMLLSRRINLLTSAIPAVAILVDSLHLLARFDDPSSASVSGGTAASVFIAPFYSVFVSYRAARSSFDVRRGRALFWFAILPTTLFATVIVVGFLLAFGSLP